uniref:Uncharacterized protein n=1 Tax=Rhizophora mucronata TaxID=61149 RepID=A0A2P2IW14_RHIMU
MVCGMNQIQNHQTLHANSFSKSIYILTIYIFCRFLLHKKSKVICGYSCLV